MRREGRQHGWVRTRMILPPAHDPRPKSRHVNVLDAPPAAGVFAKAPAKPTNHSKFTGRCTKPACAGCRSCPACKSSAKAKGNAKLRRADAVPSRWPLARHGASAAEVVVQLMGEDEDGEEGEEEVQVEEEFEENVGLVDAKDDRPKFEINENDERDGEEWFMVEHLNELSGSVQL